MKVALVSLDQQWLDKEANLARCAVLTAEARSHGCDLVVFPEMTLTGYSLDVDAIVEPEHGSHTLASFGMQAKANGLSLVFGACLSDPVTGRARNLLCLAQPDGTSNAIYAKVHPFSLVGEEKVIEAGSHLGVTRIGAMTFGATVCYDLRFAELYGAYAPDCDAAIVIASWPLRRIAHWRALLVARAIENQFYMIGVNRIGTDGNGVAHEKSSMVVGPDGTVLQPLIQGEEMDVYRVDAGVTKRYRDDFPTIRDKRYSLYRELQRTRE